MLNGLYGKWGQKSEAWTEHTNDEHYPPGPFKFTAQDRFGVGCGVCLGKTVWLSRGEHEAFDSFPAISAFVTAYARTVLYEFIDIAGRENVAYMDTDALMVNRVGYDRLALCMGPGMLGRLRLADRSRSAVVRAAKDYVFGRSEVIKGISNHASKIGDGEYLDTQKPGLFAAMGRGKVGEYRINVVRKRLERIYTKGEVQSDGRVVPFSLDEPARLALTRFGRLAEDSKQPWYDATCL
jgi:hypothetical protein